MSLPTAVEKGTQLVLSTAAHPLPPTPRMIERDQAKLVAMKEKLAACGLFRAVGRGFDLIVCPARAALARRVAAPD